MEHWSAALEEKCAREQEKLQSRLTKLLQENIGSLLETGAEADLTVPYPDVNISLHSCLLQVRLPRLWSLLRRDEVCQLVKDIISKEEFLQMLRYVYTENDLGPVDLLLQQLLTGLSDLVTSLDCCSQNIAKESLAVSGNDGKQQAASHASDQSTKWPSYCSLGEDLLELFHSKCSSDVEVNVSNTVLQLHRCVLAVRSSYFAAMLGGQWRESTAKQINLERINSVVMEQAFLYMYGGMPAICLDSSELIELVTIADMYGLQGLKDIISFHMRKACHFFHKPCADCVPRVLSVLPTAQMFGLDEVWERGLRWCSRYVSRVWSAKQFASLPSDTQDQIIAVTMQDIMSLGLDYLDEVFCRAIYSMPTCKACATFVRVWQLQTEAQSEECTWSEGFKQIVGHLDEKCEHFMRLYINQLINTEEWKTVLTPELQERVKEGAWYICVGDGPRIRGPPRGVSYTSSFKSPDLKPSGRRPPKPPNGTLKTMKQSSSETNVAKNKTSRAERPMTMKVRSSQNLLSQKPAKKSAGPRKGDEGCTFKAMKMAGDVLTESAVVERIKPVVRKSSSEDHDPDASMSDLLSNMRTFPSVATINTPLVTPTTDGNSGQGSQCDMEDVFSSPEREYVRIPPTIIESIEVEAIHFSPEILLHFLSWHFLTPGK